MKSEKNVNLDLLRLMEYSKPILGKKCKGGIRISTYVIYRSKEDHMMNLDLHVDIKLCNTNWPK